MATVTRDCRDCQQCCIVPEIDGLKKAREHCPNLDKTSCTIYDIRPDNCREYECMWILGLGTIVDNPTLSGILLEKRNSNLVPPTIYVATEVWKDAFTSESGITTMNRFSRELNSRIIMVNFARDKVAGTYRAEGVM